MSWFKKTKAIPVVAPAPVIAPAPQPTAQELLAKELETASRQRAGRYTTSGELYARTAAEILQKYGLTTRADALLHAHTQHKKALKHQSPDTAFSGGGGQLYRMAEWLEKKTFQPLLDLEAQIASIAGAREQELQALKVHLGVHKDHYIFESGVRMSSVFSTVSPTRRAVMRKSLGDTYFDLPVASVTDGSAGVVAPETYAALRQEIIAKYDPKILDLCHTRATLESTLDTEDFRLLYGVKKKFTGEETSRGVTRAEYYAVQHLYRTMLREERIAKEQKASASQA